MSAAHIAQFFDDESHDVRLTKTSGGIVTIEIKNSSGAYVVVAGGTTIIDGEAIGQQHFEQEGLYNADPSNPLNWPGTTIPLQRFYNNYTANRLGWVYMSGVDDLNPAYADNTTFFSFKRTVNGAAEADVDLDFETIYLGFTACEGETVEVWGKDGTRLYSEVVTEEDGITTVDLSTSFTGSVFTGLPYTMKYVFSEQIFKASSGKSTAPSGFIKSQIRNGAIFYNNSRGFTVTVKPKGRPESVNTFVPEIVADTVTDGKLNIEDGFFKFPIFTSADDTVISLENDSALPSNFSSAEFETFVHPRSNRHG